MSNFNSLHPKDRKHIQKKCLELYGEVTQAKEPSYPVIKTVEVHSRRKGRIEQIVKILHNRVTDLNGQVILKMTSA